MGASLHCIWTAYTTAESPEVAADAAEPLKLTVATAIFLEVVTYTAEPHKAVAFASVPCAVVASSDALPADELSPCLDPATEALLELSDCPVMAMEAVYKLSSCLDPAKEAVLELTVFPALRTIFDLYDSSVPPWGFLSPSDL